MTRRGGRLAGARHRARRRRASAAAALGRVGRSSSSRFVVGAHRDALPDFTAYWGAEAPIDALHSPGYGTVVGARANQRSGGHASDGPVWISEGRSALEGADIRDRAPTVLDLLGIPIRAAVQGRSLGAGERAKSPLLWRSLDAQGAPSALTSTRRG